MLQADSNKIRGDVTIMAKYQENVTDACHGQMIAGNLIWILKYSVCLIKELCQEKIVKGTCFFVQLMIYTIL